MLPVSEFWRTHTGDVYLDDVTPLFISVREPGRFVLYRSEDDLSLTSLVHPRLIIATFDTLDAAKVGYLMYRETDSG